MATNKLVYQIDGKPTFGKLLVFALQQVLAVLAATIAVPNIIGLPVQVPAAILGAGLGTITYLLFTRFKSPVIISSSFAFIGALCNAVAFGYMGIALGALFAGLVYVIIAIVIKFAGTAWIRKLTPRVIIGPTVALIGLSLSGSAMSSLVSADSSAIYGSYNLIAILCGIVTFLTVIFVSVQNKSGNLRLIPFIVGIITGYALASIFTAFGMIFDVDYLKIVDWSPLVDSFKNFSFVPSIIDVPQLSLVEGIKELVTGEVSAEILAANPNAQPLTWIGVGEVALAFIPVAFVTFTEHIADHKNLSIIIDHDLLEDSPGIQNTLLGDGVGSIVGTFFGVCPNTTYGESVGCVAITKNASVRTTLTAAIMLVVLAFLAPITNLLSTIPSCVMGGVCLTLYGFIAVSGLKMFRKLDMNDNHNLFTIAVILISGIGGLSIKIPYAFNGDGSVAKVIEITSIATALFLGILTNTFCNILDKGNKKRLANGTAAVDEEGNIIPVEERPAYAQQYKADHQEDLNVVEEKEDNTPDEPEENK